MTWHRSDDGFPEHPKCDALAEHFGDDWATCNVAFATWHHMGCDCAARRTDGVFNASRAHRVVRAPREVIDRALAGLLKVGLLDKHRDGFVFHDWAVYQPTRAELDAERAAKTERQKRWRENHPKNRGTVDGGVDASRDGHVDASTQRLTDDGRRVASASVDGGVDAAPSRPVPTRPVGETSSLSSPPGDPPSGATSEAPPKEVNTTKPEKVKRAKPAPPPDTIPMPGTLARRIFDAILADRALAPIVANPGDAADRWADPATFPGVDVLAEVKRAGEYAATKPGRYTDGRAFLRGWLQRKADEVARAPKPAASAGSSTVAPPSASQPHAPKKVYFGDEFAAAARAAREDA